MRKCSVCGRVLHFVLALASAALFIHSASGEESPYATGGEVTILKPRDYVTTYIHTFTNTAEAAAFASKGLRDLKVRYLVVGAGGAGGNYFPPGVIYGGGGGGGGGGVCEKGGVPFAVGSTWQIFIGAGGVASVSNTMARSCGGVSAISNGTANVETVPGGGGGASDKKGVKGYKGQDGASGGGGNASFTGTAGRGKGTYTNSIFGVEHGPFNGVSGASSGCGGGGGGASVTGSGAKGGEGLVSDITGEELVYGSGGGGGCTGNYKNYGTWTQHGGKGGTRAGNGADFVVSEDKATTNIIAATVAAANSGGGGAGGCYYKATYAPTRGADGIVVIRYDVWDSPCEGGDILTKKVNGLVTTWIHQFTNVAVMTEFQNMAGHDINVRYLVVGAGGAGGRHGDPGAYYGGGGGGGGGGVCEKAGIPFAAGDSWQITIGKGGKMAATSKPEESCGGTTTISNDTVDVETVPGGGGGASSKDTNSNAYPAQDGASGGGASVYYKTAGKGTYTNSIFGVEYGPFNGGQSNSGAPGEGGGGASEAPDLGSTKGGEGLVSDITGEPLVYGSGGGGGCGRKSTTNIYNGGEGGTRAGNGAKYKIVTADDGTKTTNFFAATAGAANSGGGGGGGAHMLVSGTGTTYAPTPGADGIVVISYKTYSDDCPCWGGDVVTRTLVRDTRYIYRHYFTSPWMADQFINKTDRDLKLRYLVVGAGGAGGAANGNSAQAGGGGGGGGVCEKSGVPFAVGSAWQVIVGKGATKWAETAGASSISNGTADVETVPGGGNGASPVTATATKFYYATPGAGGGGGVGTSGGDGALYNKGAVGTYASSIFGVVPAGAPFAGGSCNARASGGGGGASAAGVPTSAKSGGAGLVSNITGEELVYGSGGGGGAGANVGNHTYYQGGLGGSRAGDGGYYAEEDGSYKASPTGITADNYASRAVAATDAEPNSGGGGGGALGPNVSGKNAAGKGADGIVVIRYVYDPTPPGLIFMVK